MITESRFTKKNHFVIPNYKLYHTMHPSGKAHAGSAILIKNNIRHYEMEAYCTEMFQATNIVIEDLQGPLVISAVYSPPRHSPKQADYEELFNKYGRRFVAGGDYNAKHTNWAARTTTTKGRELLKCTKSLQLKVVTPGKPTFWPTDRDKKPDLLDILITKGICTGKIECRTSYELSSDHSPVLVNLNMNAVQAPEACKLHNRKTDWDLFRNLVTTSINQNIILKSDTDIEEAVEHFNEIIQKAAWEATPEPKRKEDPPQCPLRVRELIAEKRRMRKIWQTNRYPSNKKKLNNITAKLKMLLVEVRNQSVQEYLRNLDGTAGTEYSLWKATKKLNRPETHQPPIIKPDKTWAKNDIDKAKAFAIHLEHVFTPHTDEGSTKTQLVTDELESIHQLDPPIKKFSKKEVCTGIKNLANHKAPGYDLISATVLKQMPQESVDLLTYIYNAIIQRTYIPRQWKVAQILMIVKPGKPAHEVTSYRPISLLPITSKLMESLFMKRLMPIINERSLIPEHQFGFRKKHSTIEQVHRLVEKINKTFERKEYCSAVFLDISQAFDRVWHQGLLYKIKTSLPINYYLFLKTYLSERTFLVKQSEDSTHLHFINAGVPQGSVLGPVLYTLYTADLPVSSDVVTGTFADDTAILASDVNPSTATKKLQSSINSITSWLKDWRIKANETKSVQVSFTLRRDTCPPVTMNGKQLSQQENIRYLGIYLDRRLTWQKHIFTKRKALGMKLRNMYWLLNNKSKMLLENKLLVYKCIIKPIWTYGLQLWGTAAKSNIEILQRFQNKTLRMIVDAPWYVTNDQIHRDLKIPTVHEEITAKIKSYKDRIKHHPNSLASSLMTGPRTFKRLKRRAPQDLLDAE